MEQITPEHEPPLTPAELGTYKYNMYIRAAFEGIQPAVDDYNWTVSSASINESKSKTEPIPAIFVAEHTHPDNADALVYIVASGIVQSGEAHLPEDLSKTDFLLYTPGEWEAFLLGTKDGEFDLDTWSEPTPAAPDSNHPARENSSEVVTEPESNPVTRAMLRQSKLHISTTPDRKLVVVTAAEIATKTLAEAAIQLQTTPDEAAA